MREIKFNFYDTIKKKYIRWEESNAGMSMSAFITHENLKFLQYTGLKDLNGKEIYEGDIVRYLDQYITSTESGMDFEEFMNVGEVVFDETYGRYDISNKNGLDYDDLFDGSNDFVVIGNIYEHPHLLQEGVQNG